MMENEFIPLTVIDREDRVHELSLPLENGYSLMEILKAAEFPIEGMCGGMALCATCHIHIQSDHELNDMSMEEILMLDNVPNMEQNSRLSCQIPWSKKLSGLIIKIASN